jgi:hypothetical protein
MLKFCFEKDFQPVTQDSINEKSSSAKIVLVLGRKKYFVRDTKVNRH